MSLLPRTGLVSPADLRNWALAGTVPVSPLGREPCLAFHSGALKPADSKRTIEWLRALPSPTIAVGRTSPLAKAADLHVADEREAGALAERIRRTPIAASVLVQLLRATEKMPVLDALHAESLAYATLQAGPEYRRWLELRPKDPPPPKEPGPPVVLTREREVLKIELNRPANRNAISVEVRDALNEAFQLVAADHSIRRAIVSGRGKCFSVGGDLSEFGTVPDPATGYAVRSLALPARSLLACGNRVEFHLHGPCIGAGFELPMFAKKVVCAPGTSFQLPELGMGLIPGAGGCVSVPRRVGRQTAVALMVSGDLVGAGEVPQR